MTENTANKVMPRDGTTDSSVQTVRMSRESLERLKRKMLDSKIKHFQELAWGLLEAWMEGTISAPQPSEAPPQERSAKHREWHEKLDLILNHGEEMDVVGIQANLNWGAEAVSRKGRQRRTG